MAGEVVERVARINLWCQMLRAATFSGNGYPLNCRDYDVFHGLAIDKFASDLGAEYSDVGPTRLIAPVRRRTRAISWYELRSASTDASYNRKNTNSRL